MSGLLARSTTGYARTMVALVAGATVIAAVALTAVQAKATELIVRYDQSQLLRVAKPVAEIIIGNPTIADVAVQSKKLLVVTGKSFGTTNMILLDSERNVIQENSIIVIKNQSKVVHLQRGIARESYNCAPRCNTTVTIGDEKTFFTTAAENARLKIQMSEGSGGGTTGGGQ